MRICTGMEKGVQRLRNFAYDAKALGRPIDHVFNFKVRHAGGFSHCAKKPERFGGSWPGFMAA
jgi:hypothetical protein